MFTVARTSRTLFELLIIAAARPAASQAFISSHHAPALVYQSVAFPQHRSRNLHSMPARQSAQEGSSSKPKKEPPAPRPSSSVLLISPDNEILLLHRVQTSSAFPSAHVFPGGNLSAQHDGAIPEPSSPACHTDGEAYRLAAIRETFEESGIILARNNGFGRLIELSDAERDEGRKAIHSGSVDFRQWLAKKGGRADTEGLIPFTRWVTPTNVPKRYTTQMYVYFLPLASTPSVTGAVESRRESLIPTPTSDGGIEHTTAQFLPPAKWLEMAQKREVLLFPPQVFLLHLVSQFLSPPGKAEGTSYTHEQLSKQRQALKEFLKTSDPPWGEKCISPSQLLRRKSDKKLVMALDKPGPELAGSGRRGELERVVLVDFEKGGPRNVEIRWRKEVMDEERETNEKASL